MRVNSGSALAEPDLDDEGVKHIQRYIDMTEQTPLDLSQFPRMKIYVAWQYNVAILGSSPPPVGVIDAVQDGSVFYRVQGDARDITAIANGRWHQ